MQPFWFLTLPVEDLRFPHRLGRLCRWAVEGAMPSKKCLIVWVSHIYLSTCWCALTTLLETGGLREDFVTCITIFAVSLPVLPWFWSSQSCWVLILILFLFTPQGISSQGLRARTALQFLYIWWDSVSKCIPSIGQSLFSCLPNWYTSILFFTCFQW